MINSTYMQLYIIPTDSLESDDDDVIESNDISSNFTWNITELQDDILTFQLIFNDPI